MNYAKGLTVLPVHVEEELPSSLLMDLSKDGYGITFPYSSCCQVRFSSGLEKTCVKLSYSDYGGPKNTILEAIKTVKELRRIAKENNISRSPYAGVTWAEHTASRNGRTEYRYNVFYRKPNGKPHMKCFYIGTGEHPTPDKQFHAYRTAKLFRHHYKIYGDQLDVSWFSNWKHVRLYTKNQEFFDWKNT